MRVVQGVEWCFMKAEVHKHTCFFRGFLKNSLFKIKISTVNKELCLQSILCYFINSWFHQIGIIAPGIPLRKGCPRSLEDYPITMSRNLEQGWLTKDKHLRVSGKERKRNMCEKEYFIWIEAVVKVSFPKSGQVLGQYPGSALSTKLLEFRKSGQCFEKYSLNFGGSVGRLELDSVVLLGLLQLEVFCNSVC